MRRHGKSRFDGGNDDDDDDDDERIDDERCSVDDNASSSTFESARRKAVDLWFGAEENGKNEEGEGTGRRASTGIDALYDNRWFVKHSDGQKRTDLDALISSQFGQLLEDVQSFYASSASRLDRGRHHEFVRECFEDVESARSSIRITNTVIGTVVILDQFSRHHFRRWRK